MSQLVPAAILGIDERATPNAAQTLHRRRRRLGSGSQPTAALRTGERQVSALAGIRVLSLHDRIQPEVAVSSVTRIVRF